MGSWFSNFHIRKRNGLTLDQVLESISGIMKAEGYEPAASSEGADCGVAVLSCENSAWFSIHSDFFSFEAPKEFVKLGKPLGKQLRTDILGISCMDSDFLYLNLLNEAEETDAWMHIGSGAEMGIRRRTGLAAWKKKVEHYPDFRDKARQKYVCAEEFLSEAADCLKLPPEYSSIDYSALQYLKSEMRPVYLYFKRPEQESQELPRLQIHMYSLMPCEIGQSKVVSCINTGGRSCGLSVYFTGGYVENEDIFFEDVQWQERKNGAWTFRPISLEKVQLANGSWAYRGHDPNMLIPPQVNSALPTKKRMDIEFERAIRVRFTPKGNDRKRLDIAVVFVPDKNITGQAGWIAWGAYGTKQAFVEAHNKTWEPRSPQNVIPEDSVDGL